MNTNAKFKATLHTGKSYVEELKPGVTLETARRLLVGCHYTDRTKGNEMRGKIVSVEQV